MSGYATVICTCWKLVWESFQKLSCVYSTIQTFFREVLMLPKTWTRIMLTTALLIRFKSSEMTKYIIAFANGAVQAHNKTQHKINKAKNDRVNLTAMTLSRSAHAVILSV